MSSAHFVQPLSTDGCDNPKYNGLADSSWRNAYVSNNDGVDQTESGKRSPSYGKDISVKGWTTDSLYKVIDKFSPYDKSERLVAFPPRDVLNLRKRTTGCDCGCEEEISLLHYFINCIESEKSMMESTLEDQNYRISVLDRQMKENKRELRMYRAEMSQGHNSRDPGFNRYTVEMRKFQEERNVMRNKMLTLQRDYDDLMQTNVDMEKELKLLKSADGRNKRDCLPSYDSYPENSSPLDSSPETSGPVDISCILHDRNVSGHGGFSTYGSYSNWSSVWTCDRGDSGTHADGSISLNNTNNLRP